MMEFRRTPRQTVNATINLLLCGSVAVSFLYDGYTEQSKLQTAIGCLFAIWSSFIAISLLRRRIILKLDDTGLNISKYVRSPVHIKWSEIERAIFRDDRRPVMFAWRSSDDTKLRYTGLSARSLGPENLKTLQDIVFTKRPDLLIENSQTTHSQ
ncbi:hypothetical protein [Brucella anthropi]|uniref:hypothetical protein n=1 Tax=Brucella anthropi TaxID=529 RepID=UPI003988291E